MKTVVKKWFRDKASGILENGKGPNIIVRKTDLVNCQFLKVGATVEFECHLDEQGLIAKKVKLLNGRGLTPKASSRTEACFRRNSDSEHQGQIRCSFRPKQRRTRRR